MKSSSNKYKKFFKVLLGTSILALPIAIASCQAKNIDQPPTDDNDKTTPKKENPKVGDKETNPKIKDKEANPDPTDGKDKIPPVVVNPINPPKTEEPKPDPKPKPGTNPGTPPVFDPNNPDFFNNFPRPERRLIPSSTSNLNPIENFFQESTFKKPSQQSIYKEIYDRSFAIGFKLYENFDPVDLVPNPKQGFLSAGEGTGWLLDYAVNAEKTKYSLFFATNLHVISPIGNTLDGENGKKNNKTGIFDYTDPTDNYSVGVYLGKPPVDPINFDPLPNNSPFAPTTKNQKAKYFTNEVTGFGGNKGINVKSIIGAPKLVFAGFDFMKPEEYKQFDSYVKKSEESYFNSNPSKNSEQYFWTKKFHDDGKLPQLYKDFAIFQVDVDFTKDATAEDETFKNYVLKAVNALDESIKRVKENKVPNHDGGSVPYISYDYASIQKNPDLQNKKAEKNYEYAQQYVDDVLVAGFPGDSTTQFWARNNPTERYSFKFKTLGKQNVVAQLDFNDQGGMRSFINHPLVENYGFKYSNLKFSALPPGSSGSIGYSDYGLPIGIHSDFSQRNSTGFNISESGGLTPFNQSNDIEIRMLSGGKATLHAYNMIDGSDKKLYPFQKNSYRQNISVLYPDGIGSDKIMKTAIFPNGFKVS